MLNHKYKTRLIRPLLKYAACCSLALFSGYSQADDYHYNNMLIGDRAAGLGGAYTAISDDASGLYYNPAGIVYGSGSEISASMNALQIINTTYKDALGNGTDWKRQSIALIPNFFGIVQPFGKGKLGFSYAVTDSSQENQDQELGPLTSYNIDRYYINFNNQDSTYNIGPSYGQELAEDFSIGVTLYMHFRQQERIYNVLYEYNPSIGGDYRSYSEYVSIDETGMRPILGIMWSPSDKLSLGMTLSQTILTSSTRRQQTSSKLQNESVVTHQDFKSNKKRSLPLTTTIGAAYFQDQSLLYTADFSYYGSTSATGFVDRPATWNIALGTEYYLNPEWALRAGFYTNRANTPTVDPKDSSQLDHVDLMGISFSMSHFTRNSSLTAGFYYSSGVGDAQVNSANFQEVQDLLMTSTNIFMSASYSY